MMQKIFTVWCGAGIRTARSKSDLRSYFPGWEVERAQESGGQKERSAQTDGLLISPTFGAMEAGERRDF
jgi:hypothetical protein